MEILDSVWQVGILALLAGGLIGALVYRHFSPSVKESDQMKNDLDAARDELSRYKTNVNQHFDKTSELVNELTRDYVKVYQHLAEGAQSLADGKPFDNLLEQQPHKAALAEDTQTRPAEEISAEPVVDTVDTPAETAPEVDEHAQPFTDAGVSETETSGSETESSAAEADAAEEKTPPVSGDGEEPGEAAKPVVNVDALDQAAETDEATARVDADGADEKKTESRTTTH